MRVRLWKSDDIESSFSSGEVSSRCCTIDLTPRSNVAAMTAPKPTRWKLISAAVHIMTPPHIGSIEKVLRRE